MNLFRKIVFLILKIILYPYVVYFKRIRFKRNNLKLPKEPVIFISNHQSNYDAVYLNIFFFFRNIRFIAHDELFRNKFFNFIFDTCLGQVSRGSDASHITGVRNLLNLKKEKANIGIYPEGDISMFGDTLDYDISIVKLAKKLDMPLALMQIKGGNLAYPRWAKRNRRAKMTYHFNRMITKEELRNTSVEELYNIIKDNINIKEIDYLNKRVIPTYRRKRTMWLELGLFYCPKCESLQSLKSAQNRVFCKKCEFETRMNVHNIFNYKDKEYFKNTVEWNNYQLKFLENKVKTARDDVLLVARNLNIQRVSINDYFGLIYQGRADLFVFKNYLVINLHRKEQFYTFDVSEIKYVKLQFKDILDIVFDEIKIRFQPRREKWSAYLFVECIKIMIEYNQRNKEIENKEGILE